MADLAAELGPRLATAMEDAGVPGAAAGVLLDGVETTAVHGVTSVLHPLDVDAATLFQIGSTIKTLTATALMRLVERGALALADPVRRHLPGFRVADLAASAAVTVGDLLTHAAGWHGDLFVDTGRGDDALARYVEAMAELPQLAPPGTLFSYANTAYCVAGRLLELLTGQTYEDAVRELVLAPLGMHDSTFFAEDAILGRVAVGHEVREDGAHVARPWALPRAYHPAGGLASSLGDQLRYARFQLGDGTAPDGERLLSAAAMHELQRAHRPAGGARADEVGLSWMIQRSRPAPVLSHGGSTVGQESAFVLVPERALAIVVLTNADAGAGAHARVVRWLLDELVGPAQRAAREPREAGDLDGYDGTYAGATLDLRVVAGAEGLRLVATPKVDGLRRVDGLPPMPEMGLEVDREDGVRVLDGPLRGVRGEFVRDARGAVRHLCVLGQLHRRAEGPA